MAIYRWRGLTLAGGYNFKLDAKALQKGLESLYSDKVKDAIRMYAETVATKLEAYMKSNRPWTDRTGMAKARLSAAVQEVTNGFRIALAHGVEYGLWLELANEKKYAIIQPTINSQSGEVMEGLQGLLDKLG